MSERANPGGWTGQPNQGHQPTRSPATPTHDGQGRGGTCNTLARGHAMTEQPEPYAGRCEWCDTPHKYPSALIACEIHCAQDRGRE